ncbi:hydroxymethylpyrimidine/phosphomethylpyrimidine kinase [bacterium]|nr:hydroxymethylpyrimidine/phosphomethylpyrimidine kinase [candidate division CSSED10-310 bacterium]
MGGKPPLVLIVSGLDPTGSAGLLSDIRAAAASRVRIAPIIAATTIQNRNGMFGFHAIPADFLKNQLDVLIKDSKPNAMKIGVIGSGDNAAMLAEYLETMPEMPVVIDPVWKASQGGCFANDALKQIYLEDLFKHAHIITPNIPELDWLIGISDHRLRTIEKAGKQLLRTGCKSVLIKGGHLPDRLVDILLMKDRSLKLQGVRFKTNVRGTGCHLSTFLAAQLAYGKSIETAVRRARNFVRKLFTNYVAAGMNVQPVRYMERSES